MMLNTPGSFASLRFHVIHSSFPTLWMTSSIITTCYVGILPVLRRPGSSNLQVAELFLSNVQVLRSWYLLGRLGAFNSMNMQLTALPIDARLTYSTNSAAEALPSVFHNIADLEFQDNGAVFGLISEHLILWLWTCLSMHYLQSV